jgi:hypothetical protein
MNHAVVLHIGAVADANVKHIATQYSVTPYGRLFANVNVPDNLGTHIDIGAALNLRINAPERSNHIFSAP